MSMTLKTTKNMWRGLSVVYKITTRRSTIDVRKKSDLSRKNRTNGSPGLVRKIWDWPQPGQVLSRGWRCSWSNADRRCSNYIWVINRLVAYQGASYIRGLMVSLACCSPAHGNGLTQLGPLTTTVHGKKVTGKKVTGKKVTVSGRKKSNRKKSNRKKRNSGKVGKKVTGKKVTVGK